jgi:hypothetical protein
LEPHTTTARLLKPEYGSAETTLTASGFAHEAERLAAVDRETHPVNSRDISLDSLKSTAANRIMEL